MELSLYHPELGYYARAAQKTGRAGDFFTSVDVGPIFGELLARQFAEMWRVLESRGREGSRTARVENPSRPRFRSRRGGRGRRPAGARHPRRGTNATTPSSTPPSDSRSSNNRQPRAPHRSTRWATTRHCSDTAARRLPDARQRRDLRQRAARRAADARGRDDRQRAARSVRRLRSMAIGSSSASKICRHRASPSTSRAPARRCIGLARRSEPGAPKTG